ncbi:MAG: hypothetical protein KKG04_02945 [Candidatus Thermoplasmatota archaeon]|nr:hypothetical protein [Candidatus Thermoplasmatota archaeon]
MKKNLFTFSIIAILVLVLTTIVPINAYSNGLSQHIDDMTVNEIHIEEQQPTKAPDWYNKPTSYAQLVSWYQALETTYPNYIEVFKANDLYGTGQATGGYDLYYVRLTNESLGLHKPEVVFQGGPHGDETVGKIGLYWFTDWLFRMIFTEETSPEFSDDYLEWILNNREIYIEVDHNPYGYDHGPQRYDGNGWDINREYDYDGPGSPTGGIWGSENGKTFREFVDSHLLMTGCDFHGGVRMLIYPWADTYSSVTGTSPITGTSYSHAPPDFFYYDAVGLRLGDFMGDYGGDFDQGNVGPIRDLLYYSIKGGSAPWAYAADVIANPNEDPYVNDETFGNYPGAGMLWISPEMSTTKNPAESTFGNDTVHRYGAEVRRFVLHQTDIAEPYVRLLGNTIQNDTMLEPDESFEITWQVNGSMVVDHTYIQYSTDPDPINNPEYTTSDYDDFAGEYLGGTGWDNAENGHVTGVTYSETLALSTPGEYYFVVKAQVDQVYANVLRPDIYGNDPYLRMIKQRTDDSYYESLQGTDGLEEIFGQTWWYSPVIHVTVIPETGSPNEPTIDGPSFGKPQTEYTYTFTSTDPENEDVFYYIEWGDGTYEDWIGPYASGETIQVPHQWTNLGDYEIKAKAKDIHGARGLWSDIYGMHIGLPDLELRQLSGGLLFTKTTLKNTGDAEATDVEWTINLDGGVILLGKESTGTIPYIGPGETVDIRSGAILGLGPTSIIATANIPEGSAFRKQTGTIILFFIIVNPGGG